MSNLLPISFLIAAFTGALMLLLPHLSPQRYFFAILVPADFRSTAAGRTSLRRYHGAVVCGVVIAVVAILQLDRWRPDSLPFWGMAIPSGIGIFAFLWERRQVARQAPPADSAREVDLSSDDDRLPRWIALVLPPFALPLAVAGYLRAHWADIPARFPVHFDAHNHADGFADKTAAAVYGPVVFAGGMMLVMVLLTLAIFFGSRRGRQRTSIVKMMVVIIYFLAVIFSGIGLMPAMRLSPAVLLVPGLLFPAVLLVWIYKVVRDPKMPVEATPNECWYLGSIYVNRADPAIFVQKRIGFGYTINMGNRLAWLFMGGFVAAMIGLALVLPR